MNVEVRPAESPALHDDLTQIAWGDPGSAESGIDSSVDAWLTQLGQVSNPAIDLVRLASAAYVADRLSRRGVTFSRTMTAHVHVLNPAMWKALLPQVERLLGWISGDVWHLTVFHDVAQRPALTMPASVSSDKPLAATLLSGGLDSFSGAVLSTGPGLFLSHTDNPTVTGAQTKVWKWLSENGVVGDRVRVPLCESATKLENTTRTRALLFYALAVAVADSHGVDRVEVPENGFTSLNLSLGNDRGGALSTRSTHPWTMHLIQQLLGQAGIEVTLANPYEWMTKGELVKKAADACPTFAEGLAMTLSCAKLDGGRYKGGNPNWNCGLCVACVTRRASIVASGLDDKTPYLATSLAGTALDQLRARRALDVQALKTRVESDIDEFVLLENGPYPDDYDLTAAADLCRRGFSELAAVLPGLA